MNFHDLSNFKWLIGQWEGIQGPGVYHEEWEKVNDNEFNGKAYLIKKGEISNPEKLKLHSDERGIYYTADVSHNPKPVSFELTSQNETTFVFENPQHDFPQKITYEKKENDLLLASIEATNNGKTKKIEFNLKKIN